MAVCHLSLAGKAVKCQTRSSRHEVLYCACCGHLLLSAGSCRERTFVWLFLCCYGITADSLFLSVFPLLVYSLYLIQAKTLQKQTWLWRVGPGSLSSCADLFLPTGPPMGPVWRLSTRESLSHWWHSCRNGFSWQKRLKQAGFQRKKNPLAATLRCHFQNGMFCQKRCLQPFLLALDLETHSLMWKADSGPEVLPLSVPPFKAKAIF